MKIMIYVPESMIEICRWHHEHITPLTRLETDILTEAVMKGTKEKTGKWIKIQGGENSHLDFGISSNPIGKVFITSNFCPNCGAKMVESQESEG